MMIFRNTLVIAATTAALVVPPLGAQAQRMPPIIPQTPALPPQPPISMDPALRPLTGPSLSDLPHSAPAAAPPAAAAAPAAAAPAAAAPASR
jgi:hypothetical protein